MGMIIVIKKNRWIYNTLKGYLTSNKIVHLCGQRRTGKTTLFQTLSQDLPDSEYIFIKENQDIYEIIKYINSSQNEIFFLDEITNIKNIELLNYLYDECIRVKNKKIFITSTNSLEIYLMKDDILADRVETIPIYPLTLSEYVDVVLDKENYDKNDYLDYITTGGFFTQFTGKEQIDFIIESFYKSISRFDNIPMSKEELKASILNIMIKLTWESSFIPRDIINLVDNKKINHIQKEIIINQFNLDPDFQFIYYNFSNVVEYLLNMGIVKFIPDLSGIDGKFILINIPIQFYLYGEILKELESFNIDTSQFNIVFWGKLFENIMIISSSIQTNYEQFCYNRHNEGELDDILIDNNTIYLLEYKSNINFNPDKVKNFIFDDKNKLNEIKELSGVDNIERYYVYPGKTDKSKKLYNNLEISKIINKYELNKLSNENIDKVNLGGFGWE